MMKVFLCMVFCSDTTRNFGLLGRTGVSEGIFVDEWKFRNATRNSE